MKKDFWRKSTVVILGGGSWGTALASLIAPNVASVRLWARDEKVAKEINSTRANKKYLPDLELHNHIKATHELDKAFEEPVHAVIWAIPSSSSREVAKKLAPYFKGDEVLLHATKGVEEGTLKRVTTILNEEVPCPRIGVISGPNLAAEIAKGEPAATVVASQFKEVIEAGNALLAGPQFRVYGDDDVIGVEWAGTLKNILAIASGCLDAMGFGHNARAMLVSRGLAEMVRFGLAMGAKPVTFLGLAGVGDLLATCSSHLSRNYRVGNQLAKGKALKDVLADLGSVAEGVSTVENVYQFAQERGIAMPITETVHGMLHGKLDAKAALKFLMETEAVELRI